MEDLDRSIDLPGAVAFWRNVVLRFELGFDLPSMTVFVAILFGK